jgi:hypothetical protein
MDFSPPRDWLAGFAASLQCGTAFGFSILSVLRRGVIGIIV